MTNRPLVETESGAVRGIVEDGVAAFRGIPYAASPTAELRFAAPQPHPKWSGPRDASRPGPSVPQSASRLEAVMGPRTPDSAEENSLTVNVWTPHLPSARPLPVLVWFHGGGFTSGSGGWDWYDGRNLAAAAEIVVVTANYRLGPLGFLHLPELGVDNLGVQDQVAVVEWVARNIAGFGGDPESVTVGGQSAGAFSAAYLAAAPATGTRIRRVIAQSGPFGLAPQDPGDAAEHSRRFLEILGLTGSLDLLAGLRTVPVQRLLTAYGQLAGELARPGNVAPPLYPVLGGAGIPMSWQEALAAGRLNGKGWLTGTTRDEMTAFFAFDPRVKAITAEQARQLVTDGRYADAAARMPGAAPSEVLTVVETGSLFREGTLAIAGQLASAYVYQFDYQPTPDPSRLGSAHCAELPFFFDTLDAYPDSPMLGTPTAHARDLAATFSRAVAGFVATGKPADARWQPYESGDSATVRHFA
ncbi:carboxylesterase/lipase family protein [Amycolatopsis benzoatilytica]|uniref:carboxylesterase/lipase family protein n=1 Tax=Amycolatopsis benzoatilytica TaxID=346045 RepID=UPI000363D59C|nr:carboxylesterase family protein [Amycolatopsis benzoatilytica]